MAWPGEVDNLEVVSRDDAVQVGIDKVQSRRGAPMAQQARFDMREFERLPQERIIVEINLAHREIVGRPPPGVYLAQEFRSKGLCFRGSILFVNTAPECGIWPAQGNSGLRPLRRLVASLPFRGQLIVKL